jgi:hypothetical protein
MQRRVVRRRTKIKGGKGVVKKIRIVVMGMRSRVIEIYLKNNYVECMAEKRKCGDGITRVRVIREQQNLR